MLRASALFAAALLLLAARPTAAICNYVIEEGDTLDSIASQFDVANWTEIVDLNPDTLTDPELIYSGTIIRIPCESDDWGKSVANLLARRNDTFYVYSLIVAAGLEEALSEGSDELTVFAPTDEAVEQFLADQNTNVTALLKNLTLVQDVLKYHVSADGAYSSRKLKDGQELETLLEKQAVLIDKANATSIEVLTTSGQSVKVVGPNLKGKKSYIHLVDQVLLPGTKPLELPKPPSPPATPGPCNYTVKANDTMFNIAEKFGKNLQDLIELNSQIDDPDLIQPGDIVKLKEC